MGKEKEFDELARVLDEAEVPFDQRGQQNDGPEHIGQQGHHKHPPMIAWKRMLERRSVATPTEMEKQVKKTITQANSNTMHRGGYIHQKEPESDDQAGRERMAAYTCRPCSLRGAQFLAWPGLRPVRPGHGPKEGLDGGRTKPLTKGREHEIKTRS